MTRRVDSPERRAALAASADLALLRQAARRNRLSIRRMRYRVGGNICFVVQEIGDHYRDWGRHGALFFDEDGSLAGGEIFGALVKVSAPAVLVAFAFDQDGIPGALRPRQRPASAPERIVTEPVKTIPIITDEIMLPIVTSPPPKPVVGLPPQIAALLRDRRAASWITFTIGLVLFMTGFILGAGSIAFGNMPLIITAGFCLWVGGGMTLAGIREHDEVSRETSNPLQRASLA